MTTSLLKRFFCKVKVVECGCHEWQAALDKGGYGKFSVNGEDAKAHRVSWEIHKGPIPDKTMVCHTCDNRRCVNPDHLFLGDAGDNVRDMHSKGRAWGRRKLTDDKVVEIQKLLEDGWVQQRIADHVGISQVTVSRISLGQRAYLNRIKKAS